MSTISNSNNICKICGNVSDLFANAKILLKYDVDYFKCPSCGFIQTEHPFWLSEAYSSAITSIDIGPVDRAINMSIVTRALIHAFLDPRSRYLDFGAGYGLFVRRMRDLGFNFFAYDEHCENIFAPQFLADLSLNSHFDLITAIEVIEHLTHPLETLQMLLNHTDSVFFTTELVPRTAPKPGDWWYYSSEHGQHISFFTWRALRQAANKLGVNYYSYGSLHLLTRKSLNIRLYRLILNPRYRLAYGAVMSKIRHQKSLLMSDFEHISGYKLD